MLTCNNVSTWQVTFTSIPYAEVIERSDKQDRIVHNAVKYTAIAAGE